MIAAEPKLVAAPPVVSMPLASMVPCRSQPAAARPHPFSAAGTRPPASRPAEVEPIAALPAPRAANRLFNTEE